jgi:low affinity Fe/Cu permease
MNEQRQQQASQQSQNQQHQQATRQNRPERQQVSARNHEPEKEAPQSIFCRIRDAFHVLARRASDVLGSAWAFIIAILIIVVWGITGPMFGFSDTWQLIINTGTTIVTFLMVFLIQNTQNRDAKAVHLKLDELIRAMKGARNRLVDLEKLSDDEMKTLEKEFERIQKRARNAKAAVDEIESAAVEDRT